jgi:exopolyphosphatase / guanosine-5'-triphosphate,3'-diphosphate pyrophosphatase
MVNVVVESSTTIDSDRGSSDPIIAAIDIGTNSIHMVIVRIVTDLPAFSIIARVRRKQCGWAIATPKRAI